MPKRWTSLNRWKRRKAGWPTKARIADWALFVEGTEPALVRAAFDRILSKEALAKNGAGKNLRIGTYKFLYGTDPE